MLILNLPIEITDDNRPTIWDRQSTEDRPAVMQLKEWQKAAVMAMRSGLLSSWCSPHKVARPHGVR